MEYGIDVSHYQGAVNWPAVTDIDFAFAKVSQGSSVDNMWAHNRAGCKLPLGGYCFGDPRGNARDSARTFKAAYKWKKGMLPAVLDVEAPGYSPAQVHQWVHDWMDEYGAPAMIYTGSWFWTPQVAAAGCHDCASLPLWLSGYSASQPTAPAPWEFATIWQYTDKRPQAGLGSCDGDVMVHGTVADLLSYANGGKAVGSKTKKPKDLYDAMDYVIIFVRAASGAIYEANVLNGTYYHVKNQVNLDRRKIALKNAKIKFKDVTPVEGDISYYGIEVK